MEAWTDLYKEIADKINVELPEILWVDLWNEQISYLTEELPFPTPAVFIAFNTTNIDDKGLLIQNCDLQVDMYLFYESFSDTYQGSYNQESALEFLRTLTNIHTAFHGKHGANFSTMRRVDMKREESGGAGNLYRISFATIVEDAAAQKEYELQLVNEVEIERVTETNRPSTQDTEPLYILP